MNINVNQRYIYVDGQAVPVTEEVYQAYYRPIWRTHDFAKRHGQCAINDWRKCQGDCGLCKYRTNGDSGSVDYLYDEYELEVEDFGSDPADIIGDALILEELLQALEEIDPDGRRIAELLMDGQTDRSIAALLGQAKSTFSERKLRIRRELKNCLQKFL